MQYDESILIIKPESHIENEVLGKLLSGDLAVVVLRGFLPNSECKDTLSDLTVCRDKIQKSSYLNGALTTFGPYLARHVSQPENYFSLYRDIQHCIPETVSILQEKMYSLISKYLCIKKITTAYDTTFGGYAGSIIRYHNEGVANPLHNDDIVRDAKNSGLSICNIEEQLSCVICLQECQKGGALRMYNRKWCESDEVYKTPGALGYQYEVVSGAKCCVFEPKSGDVYLLNPRYYHEIERVDAGDRITMGFFFGLQDNLSSAIAWS